MDGDDLATYPVRTPVGTMTYDNGGCPSRLLKHVGRAM